MFSHPLEATYNMVCLTFLGCGATVQLASIIAIASGIINDNFLFSTLVSYGLVSHSSPTTQQCSIEPCLARYGQEEQGSLYHQTQYLIIK